MPARSCEARLDSLYFFLIRHIQLIKKIRRIEIFYITAFFPLFQCCSEGGNAGFVFFHATKCCTDYLTGIVIPATCDTLADKFFVMRP